MEARPALQVETPERVTATLALAGLGARAFAWLADAACIFLLWVTVLLLYSISGDLVRDLQALSFARQLLAILLVFSAGWGWDVAWELLGGGRTPGKRLAGIRVVRADGGPPGLPESLLRNVLRVVELPFGYAPGILMLALGPRQQRLGDLVAGTLVVRQGRFDLSRYDLPGDAGAAARFPQLRGRAAAALGAEGYERVVGFLRRRPELDPAPRARVAEQLARALAARAGVDAPPAADTEAFLEAMVAHAAEAR